METVLFVIAWWVTGAICAGLILKKFWDDFGEIDTFVLVLGLMTASLGPAAIPVVLVFFLFTRDVANTTVFKKKDRT